MATKKLPMIIEEFCIGCGHCVMACPLGVVVPHTSGISSIAGKGEAGMGFGRMMD